MCTDFRPAITFLVWQPQWWFRLKNRCKKHLLETWNTLDELYRDILHFLQLFFIPHLLQLFRKTLQRCFAVTLQKCFVDYETEQVFMFGRTCPSNSLICHPSWASWTVQFKCGADFCSELSSSSRLQTIDVKSKRFVSGVVLARICDSPLLKVYVLSDTFVLFLISHHFLFRFFLFLMSLFLLWKIINRVLCRASGYIVFILPIGK